jgi:hypothetical protein
MKRELVETRAVQREALVARAELQRLQMRGAMTQLRSRSTLKGMGALALGLSRLLVQSPAPGSRLEPRPWMLTAGMLLVRGLRASPTARWVTGAVAVGGALWWVARAMRTPDPPGDEEG